MTNAFRGLALSLFVLLAGEAGAAPDFAVDLRPLAFVRSPKLDGFEARRRSGLFTGVVAEQLDDRWSYFPTVSGGLRWDWPETRIDWTAGGGALVNSAFRAPCVLSSLAARWKAGDVLQLGAHAGVLRFLSPSWEGDSDVDLSATNGAIAGISVATPRQPSFYVAVDYLWASFPVHGADGWQVSRDFLDVSGWVLQLGLTHSF